MISRGGEIQMNWSGMCQGVKFPDPPIPLTSVMLMHLGHVGMDFKYFHGGTMTWDELGSLNLKWGDNTTIKYNGLQPGWTYFWEIKNYDFIVTDNAGNVTITNCKTISDLGITWDIFESPQFTIHISGKWENDSFLVAWRYKTGVKPPPDDPFFPPAPKQFAIIEDYLWGEFDKYLKAEMHAKYGVLIDKATIYGNEDTIVDMDITGCAKAIILAKTTSLSTTGNFPASISLGKSNSLGEKEYREAVAEIADVGNLLMICIFASIMNGSKSCFEPWMLWKMWQWYGSSGVVVNRDRIFDLSPWWG